MTVFQSCYIGLLSALLLLFVVLLRVKPTTAWVVIPTIGVVVGFLCASTRWK